MKTARYTNKNVNSPCYTPVQISSGAPKFPLSYRIKAQAFILAPTYRILAINDEEEYRKRYIEHLEKHGVEKIRSVLRKIAEPGKEIVLLCFEDIRKEGKWCHRRMFAEWWESKTGNKVEELEEAEPIQEKPVSAKKRRIEQTLTLF